MLPWHLFPVRWNDMDVDAPKLKVEYHVRF